MEDSGWTGDTVASLSPRLTGLAAPSAAACPCSSPTLVCPEIAPVTSEAVPQDTCKSQALDVGEDPGRGCLCLAKGATQLSTPKPSPCLHPLLASPLGLLSRGAKATLWVGHWPILLHTPQRGTAWALPGSSGRGQVSPTEHLAGDFHPSAAMAAALSMMNLMFVDPT